MSIQALLEAINKGTVAIPKALNANTRSQAEGLFNQASQMRTSALNEPAPELGNLLGSGDAGAAIAIGIARLLGIASDKDVAQFGGAYLGQKENTRQQKYKTSTDAYNRKTQGAFLNAQALEGRGGRLREDVNRKEDLTYRDTRAKVSDNQFDRSLGQSADQFNTNLDYRKGRDVKDDAFRETAFKYGIDRDQKLDTRDAERFKWQQETWEKEFKAAESRFQLQFKHNQKVDNDAMARGWANIQLAKQGFFRNIFESDRGFNEGVRQFNTTTDFSMQKYTTEQAKKAFKGIQDAEQEFIKLTKDLDSVDKQITAAEGKVAEFATNPFVKKDPAQLARTMKLLQTLKSQRAKLMEKVNGGFAPMQLGQGDKQTQTPPSGKTKSGVEFEFNPNG